MSSRQGIAAFELVIVDRIRPLRLPVAVCTLLAEIAHMLVVFDVTVMALRAGYVVKRLGLHMTVQTHRHQVAVAQRKIGKIVIEFVFDESDDIGATSAMLGMTFGAWRIGPHLGRQRMKAGVRGEIAGNINVTVQAQISLPGARESRMAEFAVGFVLSMSLNDGTRHDDPLECFELCVS